MKSILLLSVLIFISFNCVARICNSQIIKDVPDSRYINNGDGTIYDTETDLTWMRCSIGQTWNSGDDSCDGAVLTMTWEIALQSVETQNNITLLGQNDWYLPNIKELGSLVEPACYSSSINETIFPTTPNELYWSSTVVTYSGLSAWSVDFHYGDDEGSNRSSVNNRVRLVRGGE